MRPETPPKTFEEAVHLLFEILDRETREIFAGRSPEELKFYHKTAGALIHDQFQLSGANVELLGSCRKAAGKANLNGEQAAVFILETVWARLQTTRR